MENTKYGGKYGEKNIVCVYKVKVLNSYVIRVQSLTGVHMHTARGAVPRLSAASSHSCVLRCVQQMAKCGTELPPHPVPCRVVGFALHV